MNSLLECGYFTTTYLI